MTNELTTDERILLQRYYDDELSEREVEVVQTLLNESQTARVFMAALEELTVAAQAADEWAWESADAPTPDVVAQTAAQAARMVDAPLEELVPLLERFWDGEVVAEEMATVSALMQERDDVADYLARLEEVRESVRVTHAEAVGSVSFDGFWDAVSAKIDAEAATFDAEEHRVLLYRYHDGEANEVERAQVDTWIAAGEPAVTDTLGALAELRLAPVVGVEIAQERVDFGTLWPAIEDGIDDPVEAQGENVVSLGRERRERRGFLADYRQGLFAAVATMLIVAFAAGVFKDQLVGPERVVVEKTVEIVDSVEYQPGSSVMVDSPMKPVSADSAESADGAADEEPTVIWLIDNGADEEVEPATGNEDNQPTKPDDQPI